LERQACGVHNWYNSWVNIERRMEKLKRILWLSPVQMVLNIHWRNRHQGVPNRTLQAD
jgi:hypothetical protein